MTVLAHMSRKQIFLLERFSDGRLQLLTGPLGPDNWKFRIAVVYSGDHYDAIRLPPDSWDKLIDRASPL